ncbi:ergothioneine biosynthesis protein EgtB [Acidovorax sp. LjRoot117]|uniref:ergothioneine biosynthesis protein EgtB n=1 Tax=Acidovorax sp. LjRoot117 TaxID=3342255 RepID=UPI003ECDD8C1
MTNMDVCPPLTALLSRYAAVRDHSVALVAPLSAEDCGAQSMPDASPAKWHLAHTTWFFETFVLEPNEPGFTPFDPAFRVLFNSYYNGVGAKHPRAQRGLLTRPSLDAVRAYRANVDQRMARLLPTVLNDAALCALIELGLQHEQQHQELLVTDVKHLLSCNSTWPAYGTTSDSAGDLALVPAIEPFGWLTLDGGLVDIGHRGDGFAFDNECPRHRTYLAPYALASRLVTNAEWLAFVEGGGYDNPAHWLAEGWDWRVAQGLDHPLYWQQLGSGVWHAFTLAGLQPLRGDLPVVHLSYYEADAYARWVGARLPTEAEWEHAAQAAVADGHGDDGHGGHGGHDGQALEQLFGSAWQWTQSSYAAYPGFRTADGAVGEYNGKFMVNQYVLRGSSCATPAGHARSTYRNFFPATARWQYTGLRLARDA